MPRQSNSLSIVWRTSGSYQHVQNFEKIIILNLSLGMLSLITNAKLLTLPKINPTNFDLIKHKVALLKKGN